MVFLLFSDITPVHVHLKRNWIR